MLAIQVGNCQLQDSCKAPPQQIRNLYIKHPRINGPNNEHGPGKRSHCQQNISTGQSIIFETKLNRWESKIENEIQNKRQGQKPGNCTGGGLPKNVAKRYGNQNIQHRPDRAEQPGRRRPFGFALLGIPGITGHKVTTLLLAYSVISMSYSRAMGADSSAAS